jgi:hypothetical protein
MKEGRGYDEEVSEKEGCGVQQSSQDSPLTEEQFVTEYVEAGLPADRDAIAAAIDRNQDEFDREPNREKIIGSIMGELQPESEAE